MQYKWDNLMSGFELHLDLFLLFSNRHKEHPSQAHTESRPVWHGQKQPFQLLCINISSLKLWKHAVLVQYLVRYTGKIDLNAPWPTYALLPALVWTSMMTNSIMMMNSYLETSLQVFVTSSKGVTQHIRTFLMSFFIWVITVSHYFTGPSSYRWGVTLLCQLAQTACFLSKPAEVKQL